MIPILPLRDVVVYPHMVIPLFVGRERSVEALQWAMQHNSKIFLAVQKEASVEVPTLDDVYALGTIANILQLLKLPDGSVKVLVEGVERATVKEQVQLEPFMLVQVKLEATELFESKELKALLINLRDSFEQYVKANRKLSLELLAPIIAIEDGSRLVDTIAAHTPLKIKDKQEILTILNLKDRALHLLKLINDEIDALQLDRKINETVKKRMEKHHLEYYLQEKKRVIEQELGELGEDKGNETDNLIAKVNNARMSKEAKEKALAEIKKLKMMPPMSSEATVSRNYVDWLLNVPWHQKAKLQKDLNKASAILEAEHYGLEKVKERTLESLAVQLAVGKIKGPILCLVGPPGVGKTSLAESIARATGRKFVRMALGGVRDEAEIRGHRRTYVGAMPGQVIQKLAKVKVKNPLFLLDEIDKMSMDFRGDPAAALLEVLDPTQNKAFNDHYLEVDFDLSDVMFVATANSLNIPPALLDRLEVIRISGYTEDEKLNIATQYLIAKEKEHAGLKENKLTITDSALLEIIRYYTKEAGVRSLQRQLSKICRKVVKEILSTNDKKSYVITPEELEKYLGVKKYRFGVIESNDQIGQVTGLAWTEVGGEILTIEVMVVAGKGKTILTGKLGEVMQESIKAALTVVRARSEALAIDKDFYETKDIHIHVPEGATPKDGPSAGIAVATALVSALTGLKVRKEVAMTGEITLRGHVLPIGGLKEKLLAARRAGISEVLIPQENMRDLTEIAPTVYAGVTIHPVENIDQVFKLALIGYLTKNK